MNINFLLSLLILVVYCALVNAYINVRLEDRLCILKKNNSLTLLEDRNSAAIFTQQWNGTTDSPTNDCQFTVYSSWDAYRIPKGTYITITRLNFRKNPKTNECLDFIQFVDGNSPPSKRICDATVLNGINEFPLIIDHRQREIQVIIHIDNSSKIDEPLELRMVMTAHSQCNHKNDFLCENKVPYSCISRHFVNDSIANCIVPCRDEKSCWPDTEVTPNLKAVQIESRQDTSTPMAKVPAMDNFSEAPPNYITAGTLDQKLKENNQLLSDFLAKNQASILSQIDAKLSSGSVETTVRRMETPLQQVEAPLRRMENPLRQVDTTLRRRENPLRQVETAIRRRENSLRQVDTSLRRADNNDGVVYEYNDDMEACVTRRLLDEKLEENAKTIIKALKRSENRIARIESLLFDHQEDLTQLLNRLERVRRRIN